MSIRPDRAATMFLVFYVMHKPQDGLEEKKNEDDDADNGMIVVQQVVRNVIDHPHPKPESHEVRDVCEELEYAVDKPDTLEGAETDKNGAGGEEEHEGEGGEDAVCYQHLLSRIDEGLRGTAASGTKWTAVVVVVSAWAIAASWSVATEVTAAPAVAELCCGGACCYCCMVS